MITIYPLVLKYRNVYVKTVGGTVSQCLEENSLAHKSIAKGIISQTRYSYCNHSWN